MQTAMDLYHILSESDTHLRNPVALETQLLADEGMDNEVGKSMLQLLQVCLSLVLPFLSLSFPCLAFPYIAFSCLAAPFLALHRPPLHCLSSVFLILPFLALPFLALPCLTLPCLALHCLALPCLSLHRLALSCLVLPCHASPCPALHSLLPLIRPPTLPSPSQFAYEDCRQCYHRCASPCCICKTAGSMPTSLVHYLCLLLLPINSLRLLAYALAFALSHCMHPLTGIASCIMWRQTALKAAVCHLCQLSTSESFHTCFYALLPSHRVSGVRFGPEVGERGGGKGRRGGAATGKCIATQEGKGGGGGGRGNLQQPVCCKTIQCNLQLVQLDCRVVIGCQETWPEACLRQQALG